MRSSEVLSENSQEIPFIIRPEASWEECLSLWLLKVCYSEQTNPHSLDQGSKASLRNATIKVPSWE